MKHFRNEVSFNIGKVIYRNTPANQSVERPWLVKRQAFVHENEIRLFSELPFERYGNGLRIKVDLEELLEEVVITPFALPWQQKAIINAIETIFKSLNVRVSVRKSVHMRAPTLNWPTGELGPELVAALRSYAEKLSSDA
jgi:hypothetical protein